METYPSASMREYSRGSSAIVSLFDAGVGKGMTDALLNDTPLA